jgi:hypothetical protein
MGLGNKKTLRVLFVEAQSGAEIGFDELPLKEIPEDFQDQTWVEIDGDRWKVVNVDPEKPKKAFKSGTLLVYVELVERRTPQVVEVHTEPVKEIPVFQYPSKADQLPRMSGKREDLQLLEIGSWEWRDKEFTIASNRSVVREVFGKIEELILLNGTERNGQKYYTRQYDRYDLFAPLRGSKVLLETIVTEYFPEAKAIEGLTFMGSDQVADSTFVFRIGSGIVFYGQEFDEVVRYLAVYRPGQLLPEQLRADCLQLAGLMEKKGLILVDWPQRKIVEAEGEALLDYFLEGFAMDAIAEAEEAMAQVPMEPVAPVKPTHVETASLEPNPDAPEGQVIDKLD